MVDEPIDLKRLKRQSNFQIGKTVVQINLKRNAEESGPCCGKYSPLKFAQKYFLRKEKEIDLRANPFEEVIDDPDSPPELHDVKSFASKKSR